MFTKILVATDGSEPASFAVDHAADMAADKKAELVIISVVPRVVVGVGDEFESIDYLGLQTKMEDYIESMVKETVTKIEQKYKDIKISSLVKQGGPSNAIIEAANEVGADLIVVGNRGHSDLVSYLLGSVSRSIVEACTTSVLVVKDKRFCQK